MPRSRKPIRLSTQLISLVAFALLLAGGLIAFAMQQVRSTQGTLKYTIDNRMVSMEGLRVVRESFLVAENFANLSAHGKVSAATAASEIESAAKAASDAWDKYFLLDMIDEEQALADATTPLVDAAIASRDKLVARLKAGQVAELDEWSMENVVPAFEKVNANLSKLMALQLNAANGDEDRAKERYESALRTSLLLLAAATLLAGGFAWLIIRSALRRLGADPADAAAVAARIADGDLEFDVATKGGDAASLMAALARMKDSLLNAKLDSQGQIAALSRVQAMIEFTPDGKITNANENFLRLTGYTLDEIRGQHHSVFVTAEERQAAAYQGFWTKLAAGEAYDGELRRVTKDGRVLWLRGRYNPILGLDGKPFKVVKYCTDITAARAEAQLNASYKTTIQRIEANVMVADNDGCIVLMNDSTLAMLRNAEADIRKELPHFDTSKLVGQNFDVFHKHPPHQRNMLSRLTGRHEAAIRIGGRTMKLVANPMRDEAGERLGTVVEWFDRTQEVATESELQQMIAAVTAGDLDGRIDLAGKTGFFETLSKGINDLVDNVATVVDEVQTLVAAANDGDLTRRVKTDGRAGLLVKIGGGINQLTDNMAGLVAQVKAAASEVSRGADEISQGNTNLSQRTEQQASSLEETASSMEEMTSTVKQNADNAGQANQLAVAARDQAEKGGAVVSKAVKAMNEINESSKRIADIIGVIDEIAFQTNLLALNAAVEAARAGEQGRGFAVVASEVRSLAGRSASAAKEIKNLIQDSVRKVDEGSTLVTQSGATLEQIVAAVKKVTDIVAEIAAASHEQSSGIEQVNKAVVQLDELTQQNAALVEEASAASQAMAEQARGLDSALRRYRVDGATTSAGVAAAASASQEAAAAGVAERRKAGRPWQGPASAAAAPRPAAPPRTAATGTADAVWQEF